MKSDKKYVVMDDKGNFYCFWDKYYYGEPQFSRDIRIAKKMSPQGCGSSMRMLKDYGMNVSRQLYTTDTEMTDIAKKFW